MVRNTLKMVKQVGYDHPQEASQQLTYKCQADSPPDYLPAAHWQMASIPIPRLGAILHRVHDNGGGENV